MAEYRDRAARAEAELKNFRTRVERDRAANREPVIAEVLRTLLPAIDDLDRADAHGDLVEGSPLLLVAQKLRAGFERYGVIKIGAKGESFDPKIHEAIVQVYSAEVTSPTIAGAPGGHGRLDAFRHQGGAGSGSSQSGVRTAGGRLAGRLGGGRVSRL